MKGKTVSCKELNAREAEGSGGKRREAGGRGVARPGIRIRRRILTRFCIGAAFPACRTDTPVLYLYRTLAH